MSTRRSSGRTLLAIAELPRSEDALALAATASGLARADVALRLTGLLPRVLLSDDAERVAAIAARLAQQGFATLVCDPAEVPEDKNRIRPRTLELELDGFVAVERNGERHAVPGASVLLLQRGIRTSVSHERVTTTERKLSLGRAALTGGLLLSRTVKKTVEETSEARESFVLIHRAQGEPAVILYERQLDYRFLGPELQPASFANLTRTVQKLRALAPHAPLDERAAQQSFVEALRKAAAADPLDLALHLVALTHLAR